MNNIYDIRITSIPFYSQEYIIFSGVPLQTHASYLDEGKFFITIKCYTSTLPVSPIKGQHWQVSGNFTKQVMKLNDYDLDEYIFENPMLLRCTLPESGEAFIRFIATEQDFIGIGESKARAIWEALGTDIYQILSHYNETNKNLLKSIITEKSIEALYEGFHKYKNLSQCNFLSQLQIPSDIQQRIIKFHTEDTISQIKENPYILGSFGLDFQQADIIAKNSFNISDNDPRRLNAAVESALQIWVQHGHTYANQKHLTPILFNLLGSSILVEESFAIGAKQYQYIRNPITGTIHPTAQLIMENVVSKRLLKLASSQHTDAEKTEILVKTIVGDLAYKLTDKQYRAVHNCLNNDVCVISGSAGTGKTTVLRAILHTFASLGFKIHAIALSGRASLKLQDSIGYQASTIAAFLHSAPLTSVTATEQHILVIDEASMLDLPTMFRIVNHINPKVRLILIGDPNQLPPIGCGKILSDIIVSTKVVTTTLDIVKRQAGKTGIPEYAELINNGFVPHTLSLGNVFFHETPVENIANVCCDLYATDSCYSRVIAPTRSLCQEINLKIQNEINSEGKRFEFNVKDDRYFLNLRLGDDILFTKNYYDKNVQNGSLGTLKSICNQKDVFGIVELDTKALVEIDYKILDCIELGYCITLHKAQGSQFHRIIIALKPGRLVDRAWLYTAITRAEHEVHIVGSESDLNSIIGKQSSIYMRNTYLAELLKGECDT